ncbi:PorT family protein [Gramella sp. AN32]|uniref:PorT family protein n=1 Tax=Christiangramia antarctica TaxID=2058158 RepID=A0ABW5X388_9FLAO|nr:PorT family protein [Gramella sp. AN32]MCM4157636.1 hypothetical protein [Gramella sp. AN32]
MKKILIITMFFTAIGMTAQETKFGLKGGLNYGATGDYETFSDASGDFLSSFSGKEKAGYHAGLFAQFQVLGIFLQPELVYTKLNTEYSDFEYSLQKLDAPILLGINVLGPLNIKAGPSFQYILKNELEKSNLSIGEVENDISVGYQLGAGLNLGKLGFDVRYEGAFTENTAFGLNEIAQERFSVDSRPSQWIFSVAYDF